MGLFPLLTFKEPERKAAVEEKDNEVQLEKASLKDSLKDLVNAPVPFYVTMAGCFRFVNMLACDYFFPAFMLTAYPAYKNQFASCSAICIAFAGFVSSISGGVLSERLGPKNHKNYSRIAMAGSALAWPFFTLCCLTTGNFWLSIVGMFGKYFLGENYWAPNLAML